MRFSTIVRIAGIAFAGAASLCTAVAHGQVPADLAARIANARPQIDQCLQQQQHGRSRPLVLDMTVTAMRGGVVVDAGPDVRGPARECVQFVVQQTFTPLSIRPGVRLRVQVPLYVPQGFSPGQEIDAYWGSAWYPARVVRVEADGSVLVHYDGWGSGSDETLTPDHVRLRGGATPQPPMPIVTTLESPPEMPVVVPPSEPARPIDRSGNLIVNGGFEMTPVQPGGVIMTRQIPGWILTAGRNFEVQNHVAGAPAEGNQHLELDSDAPTAIAQDVRTRPGATYEVRVSFSARPGTSAQDNRVRILWDGSPIGVLEADGSGRNQTSWTTATLYVTARGPNSRLEFRDEGVPDTLGSYIDDVRVTQAR